MGPQAEDCLQSAASGSTLGPSRGRQSRGFLGRPPWGQPRRRGHRDRGLQLSLTFVDILCLKMCSVFRAKDRHWQAGGDSERKKEKEAEGCWCEGTPKQKGPTGIPAFPTGRKEHDTPALHQHNESCLVCLPTKHLMSMQ